MLIFVLFCTFLWIFIYVGLFFVIQKHKTPLHDFSPPVSIIIAARNEVSNLSKHLPQILSQQYHDFEVIIAVNQNSDNTIEVLQKLKEKYVHLDWIECKEIPEGMSPKKYAITQAIQKSKYEYLLFTDADCAPNSHKWIAYMVAPFAQPHIEIVLGYSPYQQENSLLNSFIQYETTFTALQYLGLAKLGLPYMGVGRNLAYKKSLFEKYTFSTHKHILSGDDDLFINQAGNKKNTAIQTDLNAWVYSVPKKNWHSWYKQKSRHISTGKHYRLLHLLILGVISLLNFIIPFLSFLYFLIQEKFYIFAIPLMFVYLCTSILLKQNHIKIKVFYFILLPFMYSLYQIVISIKGTFSKQKKTW